MARATALLLCAAWCAAGAGAGAHTCCPDDLPVLADSRTCQGLGQGYLRLNCSGRGVYHLDPASEAFDTFQLMGDQLQVGPPDNQYNISGDSFCLTRLSLANGSERQVAMVCFPEDSEEQQVQGVRHLLNGVCLCISAAFLLATLLVYCALPELRDLDGRCLMGYMLSLAIAYISLALLQFHGHHYEQVLCAAQAFFLYFWMMSAFFWLNLVSFNVWRRTVLWNRPLSEGRLLPIYCAYGYGLPLLFLGVALVAEHTEGEHIRPGFGDTKCWFDGPQESWAYFYGPVAVLLTCNLVFFVWTAWCLWRDYSHITVEGKLRSMRYKCRLYLKLLLLMGITWIFELISYIEGDSAPFFWYCTDLLNCLQGVVIFLLVVVFRKRALRGLVKRRPWGVRLPYHWAQGVDEESEAMLAEEELGDGDK